MAAKYRADHKSKHRARALTVVVICSLLLAATAGGFVVFDVLQNQEVAVRGVSRTVAQEVQGQTAQRVVVDEPLYTFTLPPDWKETARQTTASERSVTWQWQAKEANRWLKLYVDTIPANLAANRLLPVEVAHDTTITYGQLSENCATFTGPAGTAALQTNNPGPTRSKWQQIDFICDLTKFVENKVGVGSVEGINTISLTGPTGGSHRYFFLYTDHNIQPNYGILYDALRSFLPK